MRYVRNVENSLEVHLAEGSYIIAAGSTVHYTKIRNLKTDVGTKSSVPRNILNLITDDLFYLVL